MCVIKPEISTKRKGTCPHLWRYLISTGDVGLEKTLVDIFSVARDAGQRDMSICLMGSLVNRLRQQIGRSGHGENVMCRCLWIVALWIYLYPDMT